MLRKLVVACGLGLSLWVLPRVLWAEQLPPAGTWIPQDAALVLELSRPEALLDLALDPQVGKAVTSLPAYQKQSSQPGFKQFMGVVNFLELRLGTDWREGVRKLLGGGATFAVFPNDANLLIVDSSDAQMLDELHEIFLGIAREEAEKQGDPGRVESREYQGVTGWTFNGGEEVHAVIGSRLLVSNKTDVLKAVLDLRSDPARPSLAMLPAFQAARKAAGPDAAAVAFVNLAMLKQHPPFAKALTEGRNPLGSLLLAGAIEAVQGSDWLAIGLHVEEETLRLEAIVDAAPADPSGPASFALPGKPGEGTLPNLSVPRRIAGLSFYRDLHSFYAAKDKLFPERTSGLIFFENMMGIFFSGRNLTDEVLAETRPEIRLVVAEQEYDPSIGTPAVQMPAFAAVLRLRNPKQFAVVVEGAWQKALGLINITRGQQALPGLIFDRETHNDTKFSLAYFSAAEAEDKTKLEPRFNFRPALAMPDDYLIISSTESLARDLIDAVTKETEQFVKPLAEAHSLVEVNVVQLASILQANRENLIRQNMVNEGNTREQAETAIDVLLAVVKHLGQVKLDMGTREGQTRATLVMKLSLPR